MKGKLGEVKLTTVTNCVFYPTSRKAQFVTMA